MHTETSSTTETQALEKDMDTLIATSRIFAVVRDSLGGNFEISRAKELAKEHPDIASVFVAHHVDSLHGATSFSLDTVLEHGLVPASTTKSLGVIAVGLEHHSQPYQRRGIHVVPWSRAGETTRYAERRVNLYSSFDYVTPENAAELAGMSLEDYKDLPPSPMRDHMIGVIEEAREFLGAAHFQGQEFYPVVYGIDSSKVPSTTPIEPTDSRIRFDVEIGGIVPTRAISGIFVPQSHAGHAQAKLDVIDNGMQVFSLEELRQLDIPEYGWLLPK